VGGPADRLTGDAGHPDGARHRLHLMRYPTVRTYAATVSDGLEVETAVLREAGRSLRAVHEAFTGARDTADVGSDVIAHARLRDRLHDFGANWDRRRTEMATMIEGLGTAAEGAATAYERIESELVAALQGQR
jgi:hypothetical protein